MNKETIIAGIEKYVSTLPANEKAMYENSMKEYSLKDNKDAKAIYPILELVCIVQELKREIKEQAQKETKGASYVKRSKLATKLLAKCYRERWQKAFIDEINGEKMQCMIIDGYYAFMLKNALDVPMQAQSKDLTLNKFLPDYRDFTESEYDIAEIKAALKLHKAKKEKTPCFIPVNETWYNAEYFINVVDVLGGGAKLYQNPNVLGISVFENENGLAILCPVKKKQ